MTSKAEKIFGIKEVYSPPGAEAEVDIVAIHGLNGDAIKTWTTEKTSICWLFHPEFLPKYIPNARVLVWGYNASFSSLTGKTPSKERIHHHAQTLVAQLYADRKLEKRDNKPIIFLCHSLGGIIVKRALSYSNTRTSEKIAHTQSIATCTYGILFFGTPHHGTSRASLLAVLQKLTAVTIPRRLVQSEPDLISALQEESETLQNITDYFIPLMKNYCIYFFWEQEQTKIGPSRDYIVDKESAAPTFDNTERSGIAADHRNMVQFENNKSPGFRLVAAALDQYCEDAPDIIRRRWAAAQQSLAEERRKEALETLRRMQPVSRAPHQQPLIQSIEGNRENTWLPSCEEREVCDAFND